MKFTTLPSRGYVAMSLQGSEAIEAISYHIENKKIATLLAVAHNDKMNIATQPLIREGKLLVSSLRLWN